MSDVKNIAVGNTVLDIKDDEARDQISELSSNLAQNIVTEDVNLGTQNISQGARGIFTANVAKTGYTPIGIVEIGLSSNYMVLSGYTVSNNSYLQIIVWNYESTRDQTVTATVLYKKNT